LKQIDNQLKVVKAEPTNDQLQQQLDTLEAENIKLEEKLKEFESKEIKGELKIQKEGLKYKI